MAAKTFLQQAACLNLVKSQPAYVGLFTTAPNDSYRPGTVSGVECSGNNYARVVCASWTGPSGAPAGPAVLSNAAAVEFAPANGAGWGTVSHFGVFNAISGGTLMYWGPLNERLTVVSADYPVFPVGNLMLIEN